MGITKNAVRWINEAAGKPLRKALDQIQERAVQIAEERRATRLGENHLEQALAEFLRGEDRRRL